MNTTEKQLICYGLLGSLACVVLQIVGGIFAARQGASAYISFSQAISILEIVCLLAVGVGFLLLYHSRGRDLDIYTGAAAVVLVILNVLGYTVLKNEGITVTIAVTVLSAIYTLLLAIRAEKVSAICAGILFAGVLVTACGQLLPYLVLVKRIIPMPVAMLSNVLTGVSIFSIAIRLAAYFSVRKDLQQSYPDSDR